MAKKNELMNLDPDLAAMMEMTTVAPEDLRKSIHEEDKREPRIMLVQAMSELATDGSVAPGSIAHGADGFVYAAKGESLTVVPILYFKSRKRFEIREDSDGTNRVLCESRGGRVGQGDPGGVCASCNLKDWKDQPDGTRKPPECDPQHNFLLYIPDADEAHRVAIMQFARTSYPAGTKFINKLLGLPGVFWMYGFQIIARQAESGRHKFFVYDLKQWEDSSKFEKPLNLIMPSGWTEHFTACEGVYSRMRDAYDFSNEQAKSETKAISASDVPF